MGIIKKQQHPRKRVVILGTGFAAVNCIEKLDFRNVDVVVVSPRNHFLFTPLLPSTTVGTIEFRSIIEPIRRVIENDRAEFYQAEGESLDTTRRIVHCKSVFGEERFEVPYDILIIAIGAVNRTFGIPGVLEHAMFLKELADARSIRQRIIGRFEQAAVPGTSEALQNRLLQFVVVGGGPTGVEFAAELHDFIQRDLKKWFPDLRKRARILLIEAGKQLLHAYDAKLSEYAAKRFLREQIEVRTEATVVKVEADRIVLKSDEVIPFGLLVWSTGVGPAPFIQGLNFAQDHAGRIIVDRHLQVKDMPDIYAVGDCAVLEDENIPATAQVAQQEGKYLAKIINARVRQQEVRPFRYRHMGMLAYVGDNRALIDSPGLKGTGYGAWLFWRSAYLTKMVSFKNKVLVLFDWTKAILFGRDISRF